MKKRKKNYSTQIKTSSTDSIFIETNSTSISVKKKLNMRGHKITNSGQPTYEDDIVSLGYLRSKFLDRKDEKTGYLPTKGGSMNGEINMGGSCIKNIQFPTTEQNNDQKNSFQDMLNKDKTCAINAESVNDTVTAIQNDSYLDKVENTIQKLEPDVKKLEDLLGIKAPESNSETPSSPEDTRLIRLINRLDLEGISETNYARATNESSQTTEIPYVAVTGDKMSGDLNMGGKSIRGLPMSPQKGSDAASLGYLRELFACGGCVMQGDISLSKTPDNTAPTYYSTTSGNITNLRTPTIIESHHAANLEFIKQKLPGPKFPFVSVINQETTYILQNGNFNWGVGINNQSSEVHKYASISGTEVQLKPNALYTFYWTAIVSINLPEEDESKKEKNTAIPDDALSIETTTSHGKLTLKLMAPVALEETKTANKTRSPDPDTGETAPLPESTPDASIIATYPIGKHPVSLSCQIPIPLTSFNSSQTKRTSDVYSLYLEFDSSVKIEYSNWNLLVRPFPQNQLSTSSNAKGS